MDINVMKDLMDKYRTGNITPEEFDILSEWAKSVPDKVLSDLLSKEWEGYSSDRMPQYDFSRSRRRHAAWISGIAAAILVFVCVGAGYRLNRIEKQIGRLASTEMTVKAGNEGMTSLTLPDGTNVTLNARSTITYPSDFGMNRRHVVMSGEGFFDVAKDVDKPFTVSAPGMDIMVSGTKFNVYAYPEDSLSEMSLVEGSVSVRSTDAEIKVSPNEKVTVVRSTGKISTERTDNELETSWLKGKAVFVHEPLHQVFNTLERLFGVKFEYPEDLDTSDLYTGSFPERNISEVLSILQIHYGFTYRREGNRIMISRSPYGNP